MLKYKIKKFINMSDKIQKIINNENISEDESKELIKKIIYSDSFENIVSFLNIQDHIKENYFDIILSKAESIKNLSSDFKKMLKCSKKEIKKDLIVMKEIKEIQKEINLIYNSDLSWDVKYSMIFSKNISTKLYNKMNEANLIFDYYDPDMDYSDDVIAFVSALNDFLKEE